MRSRWGMLAALGALAGGAALAGCGSGAHVATAPSPAIRRPAPAPAVKALNFAWGESCPLGTHAVCTTDENGVTTCACVPDENP